MNEEETRNTQNSNDQMKDELMQQIKALNFSVIEIGLYLNTHPNDVRALWGVREDFGAQDAIFVAYSGVTNGAYEFTKGKKYKIVDVNDLINLSIKVNSEDDT